MNQLQIYQSPKKRVNINLPVKLLTMIAQTFPHKNRSQVIAEATAQQIAEVQKNQMEQSLKKGYQLTNKLYAKDQKEWEKLIIHDAPEEKHQP